MGSALSDKYYTHKKKAILFLWHLGGGMVPAEGRPSFYRYMASVLGATEQGPGFVMDSSKRDPKNSLFPSLDCPLMMLTATWRGMPWAWLTWYAKSSRHPLHLQKMHLKPKPKEVSSWH